MPHIVVEQSPCVTQIIAPQQLCKVLFDTAWDTGVFASPLSIKVRIHTADAVLIGTENQGFLHTEVRMLAGRTDADKAKVTSALLEVLTQQLPTVGSLSVDTCDLHAGSYTKRVL